MAERINTILLVPQLCRLLRFLGKSEWKMQVYENVGVKKFEKSKCTITWSLSQPNELSLVEVEEWTGERIDKKLELVGHYLERLTEELNKYALDKAKEEFLKLSAKQYLNDKLLELDP